MQKILITGSNGLLGQSICSQLPHYTFVDWCATSKSPNQLPLPPTVQFFQADLTEKNHVEALLAKLQPTIVIHTAALTQPDACETDKFNATVQNVITTANLATTCAAQGSLLVYLSTDFVFDGKIGNYHEQATPNPVNFYGHTKWEGEKVLANCVGLRYATVRTCLVYGIHPYLSRPNIVSWVCNNLRQNKAIRVVNDQFRTPTWVDDLAWACLQLATKELEGIWHIGGEGEVTPYQMALLVAKKFDLPLHLISPTDAAEFKEIATRPLKTGLDSSKAKQLIGYQPHTFEQGLEKLGNIKQCPEI